jgi:thioester reductase-like protein
MYNAFETAAGSAARAASTLIEVLRQHASARPNAKAFTFVAAKDDCKTLTYGELGHVVSRRSVFLRERFPSQSRILLALKGNEDFVIEFLSVVCAGHIAVPVYPSDNRLSTQSLSRIRRIAQDCTPAAVITRDANLSALGAGTKILEPGVHDHAASSAEVSPAGDGAEVALIQYTSGSTGDPKGVIISAKALKANSDMLSQALALTPHSCGVGWLPLYHDMGLMGHVVHPVFVGTHSVLMETQAFLAKPLSWLETISRYRAEISSAPDFAYRLCAQLSEARVERAELDLSSWRLALNGSEPVRIQTMQDFSARYQRKGFKKTSFFPCYGLAESTLFVTGGPWLGVVAENTPLDARASCGGPGLHVQLAVVDPTTSVPVVEGETGEIWVSSPSNGIGYWGRPTLSKTVFEAEVAGDGSRRFLRTGDVGRLQDGQLEIAGRLKNVIIVRGRNLHSEDIEEHLATSIEGLRSGRVCATSVQHGGTEHLVIVAEVAPASPLDSLEQDIRRLVAEQTQVQPLWVVFVHPKGLPRTSSGKLRRQLCAELLVAGRLDTLRDHRARASALVEPPANWLEEVCAAACAEAAQSEKPVGVTSDFFADLGLDSLLAVTLADALSEQTGVAVSTSDIYKFSNIRTLALRIQELIDGPENRGSSAWDPEAELDFLRESELTDALRDAIASTPEPDKEQMVGHHRAFHGEGVILVAGATGFLGPHIVDQLLRQTRSKVIAIVRAAGDAEATNRLRNDMAFYRLEGNWGDRLECVAGDISQPGLGIHEDRYDTLAASVDLVFNNAAEVNFLMPYSRLKNTNVGGLRHLLQFCFRGKKKHLCHTSTQGIYEAHGPDTFYTEDAPLSDEVVRVAKGYARTKLVGEHLIGRARNEGAAVSILRVGMVSGDAERGIANGDPLVSSLLLGCAQCGAVPEGDATLDMSPVDTVARAMVTIAKDASAANGTFHVSRRGGVTTKEIADMLRGAGVPLEVLPFAEWKARILSQGAANALHHYRWIVRELTYVPPRALFGTEKSEQLLAASGTAAPEIDASVVAKYLHFYGEQGRYPVLKG